MTPPGAPPRRLGRDLGGPAGFMGRQLRRTVVVLGLLVILPGVAVAERIRTGAGRRFGRRGILVVSRLLGVSYELEGDPGTWPLSRVVVANHSSLLDVPALLVALPDSRFLAGADLYRFPLLSSALRALGSVPLDRRHPKEGRRQITELARTGLAGTIVVFPEGAIPEEGRLRFKTGAFELAASAGVAVCPVAIVGTAAVLPPGGRLAVTPGQVRVRLLEPIHPTGEPQARKGLRDLAEAAVLAALGPA